MAVDLTSAERRLHAAGIAASEFAKACRAVEEHTSRSAECALPELINELMTELWDNGFSSGEIAEAFQAAARDVYRYGRPDSRNGTGIRGTASG